MNSSDRNLSTCTIAFADLAHRRATGEGMGDIEINIQIRACHTMLGERMNRLLEPYELSKVGYIAMMCLFSQPDTLMNPSKLCEATGETRGNMTRICDDLVEKGWMQRVPNSEDRRRVDLSLTESGMALLGEIVPKLRQRSTEFYQKNFTPAEKASLQELLAKFAEALSTDE